jgi:hypothetical protein
MPLAPSTRIVPAVPTSLASTVAPPVAAEGGASDAASDGAASEASTEGAATDGAAWDATLAPGLLHAIMAVAAMTTSAIIKSLGFMRGTSLRDGDVGRLLDRHPLLRPRPEVRFQRTAPPPRREGAPRKRRRRSVGTGTHLSALVTPPQAQARLQRQH